jgi:hypothetical protein
MKLTLKNSTIIIASFTLCAHLSACDSGISDQIEKCVQAGLNSEGPYKDSKDKASTELHYRAGCLKAASGKE